MSCYLSALARDFRFEGVSLVQFGVIFGFSGLLDFFQLLQAFFIELIIDVARAVALDPNQILGLA